MYGTSSCETLKRENDRLQAELREAEDRKREQHEREDRERRQRQKERERAYKDSLREAADWPEAFGKQRILIAPEMRMASEQLAATEADDRYTDPADKQRDLEYWRGEVAGLQADLDGIEAAALAWRDEWAKAEERIEAIKAEVRSAVAAKLRALPASTSRGFVGDLLDRLGADDPAGWLNW